MAEVREANRHPGGKVRKGRDQTGVRSWSSMVGRLLQPMGGCEAPEEKVQEIALGNWSEDSLTWATTHQR